MEKRRRSKTLVGKEASKNDPKSMKKIINMGVFKNIPVNGRNEVCFTVLQSLINKKFVVGGDNGSSILNSSLTTTQDSPLPSPTLKKSNEQKKIVFFPFLGMG